MFVDLKRQYKQSLKSSDTEENIDLIFYRPLGFAWAYLFRRLGVTPNAVTIASIFLGVGAGICFYPNTLWINAIGILLLIWANTFDSCDGQLARLTGNYSPLGRMLDGLSGDLWFAAIYIAICLHENEFSTFFGEHRWVIWTLAVLAGICHGKQAAMADYYRQFHLYHVKGREGSELDRSDDLKTRYTTLKWSENFWPKIFLFFYIKYTENQEIMTPAMQRLRRITADTYPGGILPEKLRNEFRAASKPLMKYTNILTFNWRAITLFATVLLRQPWLYFIFEITILNIILIYMMRRHEAICRRFYEEISSGQFPASDDKLTPSLGL